MHLRKSGLAAALIGVVALGLAACGGSSSSGGGTTTAGGGATSAASGSAAATGGGAAGGAAGTLTIWADDLYGPAMKTIGAKFGEENGVTVNVETVSKDLQAQFVTASQAGTGPDLVMGAHDWIGNLVQNGAIEPIPMTDATKKLFQTPAIQAVTFNGQVYGVPYALENIALYRNTALAPTAPATWEELQATATQLQSEGKVSELLALPIGTDGGPAPYHVQPIFTSGGGVLFVQNPDGSYDTKQMEMGSQGSINAMTKIGQMGAAGLLKTSIGADNVATLFTDQKAAFMVSGPWQLPVVTKSGVQYEISDLPKFADGTDARPFIGAQTMYVAAKGKSKALAQEFATNYFIQPEVAKALYDVQPRPPALLSVYNEVAAADKDIKAFGEAGVNGQPLPAIPQMASIFDPWGKALVSIIGGADPTTTTQQLATTINGILGNS
jgi:arabinogalactan oligomer/maltooligosaccharide transport system substrate-binding protein